MNRRLLRITTLMFGIGVLSGCFRNECSQYKLYVRDSVEQKALLTWLDEEVFEKGVAQESLEKGGLVGPGRWQIRALGNGKEPIPPIVLDSHNLAEPPTLELRPLGDDPSMPSAIFIGRKAYVGLIVSRGDVRDVLHSVSDNPDRDFELVGSRVALLCYSD